MLKCPECGNKFGDSLTECPNCGCPASECVSCENMTEEPIQKTTDTGYRQEKTIKVCGDIVLVLFGGLAFILLLLSFGFFARTFSHDAEWMAAYSVTASASLFLSSLVFAAIGYVGRAILYVYANISINIHEINMKT
jgi:uncharacterized membrane protein YvbJ